MTKEEVIERLNALDAGDPESAHGEADRLLADALLLAGMGDVVEAYIAAHDRVGFWYAQHPIANTEGGMKVAKKNAADMEIVEVTLGPKLAEAVQAMAQQGYLGSTPEAVIEHCLRQHLFEQLVRMNAK